MAISASGATGIIAAATAVFATAAVLPTYSSTNSTATQATASTATQATAIAAVTDMDAERLAKQATFGPTPAAIARIKELGINGWLDEQFSLKTSSYADLSAMAVSNTYCDRDQHTNPNCFHLYRDSLLPAMRFYKNAVQGDDQLRQRVALALFNIMPVSGLKNPNTAGFANYQQILLDNAFGDYGNLLRAVLLSGAMGSYLDMNGSTRSAPNENMGRELMQLFTLSPVFLYQNGTQRKDASGATVPSYTGKDVTEISRALTGWAPARFTGYSLADNAGLNYAGQLQPNPALYDNGSKTFLGITVPAGTSQSAALDIIIKRLVSDQSTAAHVCQLLIRSLVKSNPTMGYMDRVTSIFKTTGGNLQQTVRAILTDHEARTRDTSASGGKLKDPILLLTSVARLAGIKSDGYAFTVRDVQMGQQFLKPPSVFGDYPADFPLAGNKTIVSPASKLMTAANIAARSNFVWQWTMTGDTERPEFITPTWLPDHSGTQEDWSQWEAFGDNVSGMIDRINLLMLDSAMTSDQRAALTTAMTLVNNTSPKLRSRQRAQTGLYIVASSPQFQIDR